MNNLNYNVKRVDFTIIGRGGNGGCLNRGKTIELLYGRRGGGVDGRLLET